MPRATPAIPSKAKINDRFASVKKGSELTQRTGPIDRQYITFRTLALFLAICLLNVLPQCGHITAVSDTWRPHSGQVVNAISCCFCCTTGPPVRYYLIKKKKAEPAISLCQWCGLRLPFARQSDAQLHLW